MIDLKKLRYFLEIAEQENLHLAAVSLHADTSTLSRLIQELEVSVGLKLFDRLKRGIKLNDAGRAFAEDVQRMLDDFDRSKQRAARIARGHTGTIRLGFSEVCMHYPLVTDALRQFKQERPDVDLRLFVLSSSQQLPALAKDGLEASLYVGEPPDRRRLNALTLVSDRLVIALPVGHRLARPQKIALSDLVREPFVRVTPASSTLVERLEDAGFSAQIAIEVSSLDAALSLVSAGLGVCFLAESLKDRAAGHVVFKPVDDFTIGFNLHLTWPRKSAPPILQALVDTFSARIDAH